jgi:hypothetical protein
MPPIGLSRETPVRRSAEIPQTIAMDYPPLLPLVPCLRHSLNCASISRTFFGILLARLFNSVGSSWILYNSQGPLFTLTIFQSPDRTMRNLSLNPETMISGSSHLLPLKIGSSDLPTSSGVGPTSDDAG